MTCFLFSKTLNSFLILEVSYCDSQVAFCLNSLPLDSGAQHVATDTLHFLPTSHSYFRLVLYDYV